MVRQEPTDYPDEFSTEFLDYARRALEMAGIETDAALKAAKPIAHSVAHVVSEQALHYDAMRNAVPRSAAHR